MPAPVITAKTNGVNNNLGLNGTVTANGLTTGGNSWVLVYASVGNVGTNSVASVTINGVSASKICSSLVVDGTSVVEWWGLFSVAALTAVNVSVVFNNPAGAGINVITHEATGTDANSIGNVSPTSNGTSGTSSATVLCSFALSVMVGGSLTFGGSESGFVNSTLLQDQNDGAGDFATTAFNNQTTSAGTSYSVGITHASGGWGMSAFEVKPSGSAVAPTSFSETNPPFVSPPSARRAQTFAEPVPPLVRKPPGETIYPAGFFQEKPRPPLPDNPPPLRSPVVPVLTKIAEHILPPYRQPPPRPPQDNPPPLRSPVNPVLPPIAEHIQARSQPSRILPPDPLTLPKLIIPPPGEDIRALRRSQPVPLPLDPLTLPKRIIPPPGEDLSALRRPVPRWSPPAPETFPSIPSNPLFPIAPHASGRYFIDHNGNPIWINGITVWAAVVMTATEQATLIASCVANRVNLIEFGLLWRDSSTSPFGTDPRGSDRAPFANNGTLLPFTTKLGGGAWGGDTVDPDYATPNSTYFAFVKAFVNACAAAGIICLMFPSYVGADGAGGSTPADGWASEVALNQQASTAKMVNYGAFVATTFSTCPNIVWGMGGDSGTVNRPFSGDERDGVIGMVNGILSVGGTASGQQFGAEWANDSIVDDQTDFLSGTSGPTLGSTGTMRTHYQFFGGFITLAARGYSTSPPKPCVVQEGPFYNEDSLHTGANTAASPPVRRFYLWAWTSGCTAGINVGNGYIWPANIVASLPTRDDWRLHTSDQDRTDLLNTRILAETYRWWLLAPTPAIIVSNAGSGDGTNNTGPGGSFTTTVTALTATDGSVIIVYYPPNQTGSIGVNTLGLAGKYRKRYFDPTNNSYTNISGGTFTNTPTSSDTIAQPPANSAGDADQLIVFDIQSAQPLEVTVNDAYRRPQSNVAKMPWAFEALPAAQALTVIPRDPSLPPAPARASRLLPETVPPIPPLVFRPPGETVYAAVRPGALVLPRVILDLPPILIPTWTLDYPAPARASRVAPLIVDPPPPIVIPTWSGDSSALARGSRLLPALVDAPPPIFYGWLPPSAPALARASRIAPSIQDPPPPPVFGWLPAPNDPAVRPSRVNLPEPVLGLRSPVVPNLPWAPSPNEPLARASRAQPDNPAPPPPPTFGWPAPPNPPIARSSRVSLPEGALSNPAPVVPGFPWSAPPNDPVVRPAWRLPDNPPPPPPPTFGWPTPPNAPAARASRVFLPEPILGLPGVLLANNPWAPPPADPLARAAWRSPDNPAPPPPLIFPWAAPPADPLARPSRAPAPPALAVPPLFYAWPPPPNDPLARGGAARLPPNVPPAPPGISLVFLPPLAGVEYARRQPEPPARLPRPWDVFPFALPPPLPPWGQEGSSASWRGSRVSLAPGAEVPPPLLDRGSFWVHNVFSAARRQPVPYFTGERASLLLPPPIGPWGWDQLAPVWRPRPGVRLTPELVIALGPLLIPPFVPDLDEVIFLPVEDVPQEVEIREGAPATIPGMPDSYAIQGAPGQALGLRLLESDGAPVQINFPVSFVVRRADGAMRASVTPATVVDARGGAIAHVFTDDELRWPGLLDVQLTWTDPATNRLRIFPRNRFVTVLVNRNLQLL